MKVLFYKEFRSKLKNLMINEFVENGALNIEKVINTYSSYISKVLSTGILNKMDIEEILSDVFLVFWKNYMRLSEDTEVKPYLVGIARNLIKKKYRECNIDFDDIELYEDDISCNINVSEIIENNEKSKIISESLLCMKDLDKKIFVEFYYYQKKIKEIAKNFNISEAKVKIILHRSRKFIKKKLKERGYDYGK